jgi:hypothetical protein
LQNSFQKNKKRLEDYSKEIDAEILRLKFDKEDFPSIELIYKLKKDCENRLKGSITVFFEKR